MHGAVVTNRARNRELGFPSVAGAHVTCRGTGCALRLRINLLLPVLYQAFEISAVTVLLERCRERKQLLSVDVAQAIGDFLRAGDF